MTFCLLCISIKGALSVNVDSSSPTSLTISWTLNDLTATTYIISYSNTNTQCFTDSNEVITGITETIYTLTDLQEATEYSITVTAILNDGNTEIGSHTSTTMDAGKSGSTHLFVIMGAVILYSSICCSHICECISDLLQHHCPLGTSGLYSPQWRHNRLLSAV